MSFGAQVSAFVIFSVRAAAFVKFTARVSAAFVIVVGIVACKTAEPAPTPIVEPAATATAPTSAPTPAPRSDDECIAATPPECTNGDIRCDKDPNTGCEVCWCREDGP